MREFVERTRRVVSLRMKPFCAAGCSAFTLAGNADGDGAATVDLDLNIIRSIVSFGSCINAHEKWKKRRKLRDWGST